MPEIRRYTVTETRSVRVMANSAADAVLIANAAFEHGQNADCGVANGKGPEGVFGNTTTKIKVIGVAASLEGLG